MTQDLKAKFSALREFVKTIPADKLDMHSYRIGQDKECGCVLFHGFRNDEWFDGVTGASQGLGVSRYEASWLFAADRPIFPKNIYPIPTGQPAKDEFLRRLDVLEAKYCGVDS